MAVDIPSKATPLAPGDPTPADAVTQQGSTFAERAAAAKKTASKTKAVDEDSEGAENKAVAKKSASKKS